MEALGVDIVSAIEGTREDGLVVRIMKIKETNGVYTKLLVEGISPLD
ncbi:MAG: hypothetical protein J7K21_00440 [Desulfurococcales archaeon]|nr:hypothetical protein [Desulfurococcales archaeon]